MMKIITLMIVTVAALLFCNCDGKKMTTSSTAGDVTFARTTFESLARGDSSVADNIDWPVLTSLGQNLGAAYSALPTAVEKEKFINGFITQFSTSFRESGGSIENFSNWRVTFHDAIKTEVAADSPNGILTVIVSVRDNVERVSSINIVK
jgi:hypothetical protein